MNSEQLAIYALICGLNAQVEAMKIENITRVMDLKSPAYDETAFNYIAQQLDHLAVAARNS